MRRLTVFFLLTDGRSEFCDDTVSQRLLPEKVRPTGKKANYHGLFLPL